MSKIINFPTDRIKRREKVNFREGEIIVFPVSLTQTIANCEMKYYIKDYRRAAK